MILEVRKRKSVVKTSDDEPRAEKVYKYTLEAVEHDSGVDRVKIKATEDKYAVGDRLDVEVVESQSTLGEQGDDDGQ